MKGYQYIPYLLETLTWSAGGQAVVAMNKLPKSRFGRLAHLAGIVFDVQLTPTLTTAPATVTAIMQATCARLEISDGKLMRFQGRGFNALRMKERLENGRQIMPEPDTGTGTGNAIAFRRIWTVGPQRFAGSPSDFLVPTGCFENGEIRLTYGALTDYSADTTAISATIQVIALLAVKDEFVISPFYEWNEYAVSQADNLISGRCLNAFIGLADSTAYGAIAAGDFGALTVDIGGGELVSAIDAEALNGAYQGLFFSGQIGAHQGEPRAAGDDNPKTVNPGTPTALQAQVADLQPVVACAPGQRISKLFLAESNTRIRWSGSQASGLIMVGRLLAQNQNDIADLTRRAVGNLPLKDKGAKIKTLEKDDYKGPYWEFMPWGVKVA